MATSPPPRARLPYLIIDEGQDLPEGFYPIANMLSSNLTVLADENQRLTDQNSTLEKMRSVVGDGKHHHQLTKNYRNTREIAELAAHFYTGLSTGKPEPPTRTGDRPTMSHVSGLQDSIRRIATYVANNRDKQVGVLVQTGRRREDIVTKLKAELHSVATGGKAGWVDRAVQTYEGGQGRKAAELRFDEPGVMVIAFPSAKGLEFDTVFLPEVQDLRGDPSGPELRMTLYVMLSRARDQLFLTYSGDKAAPTVAMFPSDLMEWR